MARARRVGRGLRACRNVGRFGEVVILGRRDCYSFTAGGQSTRREDRNGPLGGPLDDGIVDFACRGVELEVDVPRRDGVWGGAPRSLVQFGVFSTQHRRGQQGGAGIEVVVFGTMAKGARIKPRAGPSTIIGSAATAHQLGAVCSAVCDGAVCLMQRIVVRAGVVVAW